MSEILKDGHGERRVRGLRRRWVTGSIVPVLVLLALVVALFSAGVSNYY